MRFLLCLLLCTRLVTAADPEILVGKEVEVVPDKLVHLIPYFDVDTPEMYKAVRRTVPKGYLSNRAAYATTAATTRAEWDLAIAEAMLDRPPKLRADCPRDVREILGSMNWSKDAKAMEFRDTVPFTDVEKYIDHTNRFFKLVKMDGIANDPMKHLGKTFFHFHLTVRNGRKHTEIADRMNTLAVLKFIEGGEGKLALTDSYGYLRNMGKGLLRLISSERIETRNHFISPEGDLRYLLRMLTQPEATSRRELEGEIRKRMTPEALRLLATYRADDLPHVLEHAGIPVDSPRVREAYRAAIRSPDVRLERFLDFFREPGAKPLAGFVATELQALAKANQENLIRMAEYGPLLIAINGDGKLGLHEPRWVRQAVTDLGEANPFVRLRAAQTLAILAPYNPLAKTKTLAALDDPALQNAVFANLGAEALKDPDLHKKALGVVDKVQEGAYSHFLAALEKAPLLGREILPLLARGHREDSIAASLLACRIGIRHLD